MSTFSFSDAENVPPILVTITLVSVMLLGLYVESVQGQTHSNVAAEVGMTNTLKFTPDTVRVEAGETVRWTNSSIIVHTVTADPEEATLENSVRLPEGATPFDSGNMDPDETFEHTFRVPGTYRYFCIPHEATKMYGTVLVEERED